MDSKFIPSVVEAKLVKFWEEAGIFKAKVDPKKKPFSIILPPPNANGLLHLGHAMYVYQDVLIRYHKLLGYETLWLPGTDHAGIETQYVFEKQLQKEGKSRFDFERETLFTMIWNFVAESQGTIQNQLRRLGFGLDWTKEKYTMDPDIVKIVYDTFKKMFDVGLVYRSERLVNYCTRCGTSYSDLEVADKEIEGKLYFIKFPIKEGGHITIATTRPETLVGDVAVMVHPADVRFKHLIGKRVVLPLVNREIPIIADEYVDPKFGTGAVKVTPAHDFNDFEIAKKHNLTFPPVIGFDGKMQNTGVIDGLQVKAAREEVVKQLQEQNLIEKIDTHSMVLKTCYRCGTVLEPLPLEQWYIKVKPLASQAIHLIKTGKIKIHPSHFEERAVQILEDFIDWNISRQNVWGIRIPAYRCTSQNKWFVSVEKPEKCEICGSSDYEQDTDIFDTWFSSAQWPFATLQSLGKEYYDYFYPTTVMETGYDILRAWVCRMIMVGYFATDEVPFQNVFLHGMVRDRKGQKMSKSKGNVINPLEMVDKHGADALRSALIFGTAEGNDTSLSEEKIIGMRNFTNKIWNIGRFLHMSGDSHSGLSRIDSGVAGAPQNDVIKNLQNEFSTLQKQYTDHMQEYKFSLAFGFVYEFLWHRFADVYIEQLKESLKNGNIEVLNTLKETFFENLKMLHPFMPFVTEAAWQVFHGEEHSILCQNEPTNQKN